MFGYNCFDWFFITDETNVSHRKYSLGSIPSPSSRKHNAKPPLKELSDTENEKETLWTATKLRGNILVRQAGIKYYCRSQFNQTKSKAVLRLLQIILNTLSNKQFLNNHNFYLKIDYLINGW